MQLDFDRMHTETSLQTWLVYSERENLGCSEEIVIKRH